MKKILNSNTFLTSFTTALSIFFIAPLIVWLKNAKELQLNYELVFSMIFITLIILCGLFLILKFLPKTFSEKLNAFLITLTTIFLIEGNFIDYGFGVFDGKNINWDNYNFSMNLEIIIISILLFLSIVFAKKILSQLKNIVAFLLIFQAIQVFYLVGEGIKYETFKQAKENNQSYLDTFKFSKKDNVILIILDTFSYSVFEEILASDDGEKYKEMFKDFTYFENAMGGFRTTEPSVEFLRTGEMYDNSTTLTDFKEKVSKYDIKNVLNDRLYLKNIRKKVVTISTIRNIVAFKYLPLCMKKKLYEDILKLDTTIFVNPVFDIQFYEDLKKHSNFVDDKVYKYFHLVGIHPPATMDENIHISDNGNYITTGKSSLKIANEVLIQLKKNKAYDNSMIIIIGDHGLVYSNLTDIEARRPMFLFKNYNAHQAELKRSKKMVSLGDIPNTIFSILNKPKNPNGKNILTIPENEERTVKYCDYTLPSDIPDMLSNMVCYNLKNAKELTPINNSVETINKNTTINLKNSLIFPDNVNFVDATGVWTTDKARIIFKTNKTDNVKLKLTIGSVFQSVKIITVKSNDKIIAQYKPFTTYPKVVEINVPKDSITKNGIVNLQLDIDGANSPKNLGLSNESKVLGIWINKIQIELN